MVDEYEMHTSVQDERTLPWMTARHWVPALIRWPTSKQRPLVGLAHRFCHCPKWRAAPEHRANNVCFMVFSIHAAPFLQKTSKSSRVNLHYAFLHLQLHGFMLFFFPTCFFQNGSLKFWPPTTARHVSAALWPHTQLHALAADEAGSGDDGSARKRNPPHPPLVAWVTWLDLQWYADRYTPRYIYIFFIMYLSYIQFRFQYIHTSDVCLMETHGIFLHGFMEIIATCLVSFMICSKTRLIALSQKAAAESIKIKHVKSPPLGIFCRKQMTIPQECPNTVYSQTRLSNLSSVLETAAHPCCIRCQTISPERIWARKGPREALVRNLKWSKAHKSDPKNFPHDAMDETTPSNHWVSEPEILPGIVGTLVCSSNYPFSQNHGVENWPKLKKTNLRGSHFNPFGTSMIVGDVQQVANRIQQCFRSRCHCIFPHGLNDGNA